MLAMKLGWDDSVLLVHSYLPQPHAQFHERKYHLHSNGLLSSKASSPLLRKRQECVVFHLNLLRVGSTNQEDGWIQEFGWVLNWKQKYECGKEDKFIVVFLTNANKMLATFALRKWRLVLPRNANWHLIKIIALLHSVLSCNKMMFFLLQAWINSTL